MHDAEFRQAEKDWFSFLESLTERLTVIDETVPDLPVKDLTFRIYRDIRFSPNPTPYKVRMLVVVSSRCSRIANRPESVRPTSRPHGLEPEERDPTPRIICRWAMEIAFLVSKIAVSSDRTSTSLLGRTNVASSVHAFRTSIACMGEPRQLEEYRRTDVNAISLQHPHVYVCTGHGRSTNWLCGFQRACLGLPKSALVSQGHDVRVMRAGTSDVLSVEGRKMRMNGRQTISGDRDRTPGYRATPAQHQYRPSL